MLEWTSADQCGLHEWKGELQSPPKSYSAINFIPQSTAILFLLSPMLCRMIRCRHRLYSRILYKQIARSRFSLFSLFKSIVCLSFSTSASTNHSRPVHEQVLSIIFDILDLIRCQITQGGGGKVDRDCKCENISVETKTWRHIGTRIKSQIEVKINNQYNSRSNSPPIMV